MSYEEMIFKIKMKIVWYENLSETADKPLDKSFAKCKIEVLQELLEEIGG